MSHSRRLRRRAEAGTEDDSGSYPRIPGAEPDGKIEEELLMKTLLLGTVALSMTFGAGLANASTPTPHLATSVPACISKSSPILDNHYGYDDRDCPANMIEGRAASLDSGSARTR